MNFHNRDNFGRRNERALNEADENDFIGTM